MKPTQNYELFQNFMETIKDPSDYRNAMASIMGFVVSDVPQRVLVQAIENAKVGLARADEVREFMEREGIGPEDIGTKRDWLPQDVHY